MSRQDAWSWARRGRRAAPGRTQNGHLVIADPAYSHLNAALGVAMVGKAASAKTGQAVDRACTVGN